MPDSPEEVRAAILARYRKLCAEHEMAQQNVELVQAHQRELMTQINDCFAAARLFEVDLVAEFQGKAKSDPRQPTLLTPDPVAPGLLPVPAAPGVRTGPSVKTLVLEAAARAYPRPVRASDVRRELEKLGYTIHEKTVGMTLYRWSLSHFPQRAGRDWYFIPPDQIPPDQRPARCNGRHYGPERVPEFIAPLAS
jgi:hypothetical protein